MIRVGAADFFGARWGDGFLRLVGIAAFAAGLFLAWHHPLSPPVAVLAFGLWVAVAARWPAAWLFALPAGLPWLNFAPWTGWVAFEEFDLLVLGALAAALAPGRRSAEPVGVVRPAIAGPAFALAFGLVSAIGAWRGFVDAGALPLGWFQNEADPINSLRVLKPAVYALALLPMTRRALRASAPQALSRIAAGMVAGLAITSLAALWERAAYPGLLNFGERYRTTALFWEMHVGGAAIDAYLALAAPFAAWALWRSRGAWQWAGAAALAVLAAHACLTTFSRGVYLGVGLPLLGLGAWAAAQRAGFPTRAWWLQVAVASLLGVGAALLLAQAYADHGYPGLGVVLLAVLAVAAAVVLRTGFGPWRVVAGMALAVALLTEAVVVLGPDSFMRQRVVATERDAGTRFDHWRRGLALIRSPADAGFGIGLGRLPARLAASGADHEGSGAVVSADGPADSPRRGVQLRGPATRSSLEGLFGLTQRVAIGTDGPYRVSLDLRSAGAAEFDVFICQMHLLYARRCQSAHLRVAAAPGQPQHFVVRPLGRRFVDGPAGLPRSAVLWLSVATVGAAVDVQRVGLTNAAGTELLANRQFADGLARWLPVVLGNFLPWHIDNLYLELLIERGALGLGCFLCLLLALGWRLTRQAEPLSPTYAVFLASLTGALIVGLFSSEMDVPRVAFLLLWCLLLLSHAPTNTGGRR